MSNRTTPERNAPRDRSDDYRANEWQHQTSFAEKAELRHPFPACDVARGRAGLGHTNSLGTISSPSKPVSTAIFVDDLLDGRPGEVHLRPIAAGRGNTVSPAE
ncbi:hypothetical protein BC360_10015 [Ensifer sp. LC163]|nr:hypothetical protein BC360_10015 [Ensifer sp. LC163]